MADSGSILLRATGLTRRFDGAGAGIAAVEDANFEIRAGSRIALVGPSGSGKSTLLHLMANLLVPSAGAVSWVANEALESAGAAVAIVFQAPSLCQWLSAVENVMVSALLQGLDEKSARKRAEESLEAVGLADLCSKLPEELSGGEAQRVAVARAMAQNARLMLADEPTGQLDRATAREVTSVLVRAADSSGAALVVATHDLGMATTLPTLWRMDHGRLSTEGSAAA